MGTTSGERTTDQRGRPRWLLALAAMMLALVWAVTSCGGSDDSGSDATTESGDDSGDFEEASDESGDDGGVDAGSAPPQEDFADEAEATGEAATDDDAMEEGDEAGQEVAEGADPAAPDQGENADGPLGAGGVSVTPTAADLGRELIFTAFLSVGVDDVAKASGEATTIIEDLGGFLFGQSTEGGPEAYSELTFKVLPDDFNLALERLGAVGELRNQTVTTDDVTERVVDLQGRIEVAELGVERLRASLEGTQTLEDYAEVERLLLDRETQLEVMRGQLRTLRDRIDLATITLTLVQERVENGIRVEASVYEGHDEGRSCAGRSREGISVEEESDVTVCFEVTNRGDQTLADIVLTDSVLEIDEDTELIAVFGELDELAPGQSAEVAYETTVERTKRLRTRVVGTPTDGVSDEPAGPSVNDETSAEIETYPSDRGPGFGDGFEASVDVLSALWTALTVVVGFLLLPLLILVPLIGAIGYGIRALRRRRPPRPERTGVVPPPPPPPSASPAGPVGSDAADAGDGADESEAGERPSSG